jgi:hypothetical protein
MILTKPLRVTALSKERVCVRSTAGIAGLNPAEGLDFRLFCLLSAVQIAASVKK